MLGGPRKTVRGIPTTIMKAMPLRIGLEMNSGRSWIALLATLPLPKGLNISSKQSSSKARAGGTTSSTIGKVSEDMFLGCMILLFIQKDNPNNNTRQPGKGSHPANKEHDNVKRTGKWAGFAKKIGIGGLRGTCS